MEMNAIDFVPWGLKASWPSRRWLEPIYSRRDDLLRGVRLGHASDSAMVLICTYPRQRFDDEVAPGSSDPAREVAFETTYTQVNLALHQIKTPGTRPDGLIGSLLQHASQQADHYRDWPLTKWGVAFAQTTSLASWQSAFSLGYKDVYLIVHACGFDINRIRLRSLGSDLTEYGVAQDPLDPGAMHWELWPSGPEVDYDDIAKTLTAI